MIATSLAPSTGAAIEPEPSVPPSPAVAPGGPGARVSSHGDTPARSRTRVADLDPARVGHAQLLRGDLVLKRRLRSSVEDRAPHRPARALPRRLVHRVADPDAERLI